MVLVERHLLNVEPQAAQFRNGKGAIQAGELQRAAMDRETVPIRPKQLRQVEALPVTDQPAQRHGNPHAGLFCPAPELRPADPEPFEAGIGRRATEGGKKIIAVNPVENGHGYPL